MTKPLMVQIDAGGDADVDHKRIFKQLIGSYNNHDNWEKKVAQ